MIRSCSAGFFGFQLRSQFRRKPRAESSHLMLRDAASVRFSAHLPTPQEDLAQDRLLPVGRKLGEFRLT